MPSPTVEPAPPRETIWTKYSPHHEFEFALTSGIVLQCVMFLFVFLVLSGALMAIVQSGPALPVKMDVALAPALKGDGREEGGGSAPGTPGNMTDVVPKDEKKQVLFDPAPPLKLEPVAPSAVEPDVKIPVIGDSTKEDLKKQFGKLEENLTVRVPNPPKSAPGNNGGGGQGGGGEGPGRGSNKGPGVGTGGSPDGTATQADIYANRWRILHTGAPREKIQKLMAVGIVLGFEDGNRLFWLIRDLKKRPVDFYLESFEKYKGSSVIWKVNDTEQGNFALAHELGMKGPPMHFLLVIHKDRQQRFADAELQYAKDRNRDVSKVNETWFDIRPVGGAFEAVVVGQTPFDPEPKWGSR